MDLELYPKQTLAFESEARELFFGGGAGGGKSHFLRVMSIYLCLSVAGLQCYLFRRISDDLYKNHVVGPTGYYALLDDLVQSGHCKIVSSPIQVKFANGSIIHLCHCQYEKDVFKYQGAEIHVLLMDELTHFSETQYRYLRGRCRVPKNLAVPGGITLPKIYSGSNPGGIGHNWVKAMFIDPKPPYTIWQASKKEGGFIRQFIPSLVDDNPSLDKEEYHSTLSGIGPEYLVRAMRDGDWNIVAGGMFDDVWRQDVHVVKPFEIPKSWKIDRSFDWGSSKPYSVCWWAESDGSDIKLPDGSIKATVKGDLYHIAELYGCTGTPNEGTKETAKEVAKKIKEYEKDYIKRTVYAGPADTAIYTSDDGHCIADNMTKEGVYWTKADKSPGSRVTGWELFREYLKGALPVEGGVRENKGLFVFENCRNFIRTIPVLPRDKNKPDDADSAAEDHIADSVRYKIATKKHIYRNE